MLERGEKAPVCFSQYEPKNPICDGSKAQEACLFRDFCLAAKLSREDGDLKPERLVRNGHVIVDGLGKVVARSLVRYQIRNGVVLRRYLDKKQLSPAYLDNPPSDRLARARVALDRLANYYFRRTANLAKLRLATARRDAELGELYIDDFEHLYGYTTLGLRTPSYGYRKITRIWKRNFSSKTLVVDLPFGRDYLESRLDESLLDKMKFAKPGHESAFPARVTNLGHVMAEAIASVIGSAIISGEFDKRKRKL